MGWSLLWMNKTPVRASVYKKSRKTLTLRTFPTSVFYFLFVCCSFNISPCLSYSSPSRPTASPSSSFCCAPSSPVSLSSRAHLAAERVCVRVHVRTKAHEPIIPAAPLPTLRWVCLQIYLKSLNIKLVLGNVCSDIQIRHLNRQCMFIRARVKSWA